MTIRKTQRQFYDMNNEILKTIETLRKGEYFGAGYATEIAKGKYQVAYSWSGLIMKIKRIIKG